jgi:uncharacterized protein involved in exopolysaccharide biosynthesis
MSQSQVNQSMPSLATERGEIDLIALFREVGRHKWLILLLTLATFVLATVVVNVIKPRYMGETRVFLENRDTEYTRIGREGPSNRDPLIDQDAIQSQVLIIQSRDIARQVIKKLGLASKPEFDSTLEGTSLPTKVGVMLGLITNPASISPEERVLDSYADKLKVLAVSKSRVIAIEFTSDDAKLASQVSNAIAEEYIAHLEQAKRGSAKSAGSWLSATIEPLRQRVTVAEQRVEAFRTQNGLFQVGRESLTNITTQQLSELNSQLATARSQQSDLLSKSKLLRDAVRQGRIFEISEVVNNDIVRRLLETRANLRAQIAQEEQTLLPQHPRIKELRAQLVGLEEQIRASAERTARTLENDARAAGGRVAAMQAEMDLQKKQNGSASEQDVQLRALEREAKAEREQLENYLTRFRDAASRDGDNSVAADARIVSNAIVPTNPSFPKKLPIILIATLSMFALSLFFTLIKALLSDHVYARRAVEMPMYQNPGYPMIPPHMMALYSGMMPNTASANMPPAEASTAVVTPNSQATVPQEVALQEKVAQEQVAQEDEIQKDKGAVIAAPSVVPIRPVQVPLVNASIAPSLAHAELATLSVQERMSKAMRDAFERTSLGLNNPGQVLTRSVGISAPPESTEPDDQKINLADAAASQTTSMMNAAPLAELDIYNPLQEIAAVAKTNLKENKPVSILVLSVENTEHSAGTVQALEKILSKNGPAIAAVLEAELITSAGLKAAADSLAGAMDYVVFNGGKVTESSRHLFGAVNFVVLVASDDLEDKRVDEAEVHLAGSDYFIVSKEPDQSPVQPLVQA